MDARALLETVAETYAKLESFEVEILSTSESGDEDLFQRNSRRARAFFSAPDKVRIEQGGRHATITISDGVEIQHYFRAQKHYWSGAIQPGQPLPGLFRAAQPLNGETFLFQQITERVVTAETLEDRTDLQVVSVSYDPASLPAFFVSRSPVTFWIDKRTGLVSRMESEMVHRLAPDRERVSNNVRFEYAHTFVNQTIPPQAFQYVPPADAVAPMNLRAGSGSSYSGPDEKKRFDAWRYSQWDGDVFVDRFELKIRGVELNFERRVSFADQKVNVAERITGPRGPTEHHSSIPL
jgi:outer membrane lipoprotein-sorting protein